MLCLAVCLCITLFPLVSMKWIKSNASSSANYVSIFTSVVTVLSYTHTHTRTHSWHKTTSRGRTDNYHRDTQGNQWPRYWHIMVSGTGEWRTHTQHLGPTIFILLLQYQKILSSIRYVQIYIAVEGGLVNIRHFLEWKRWWHACDSCVDKFRRTPLVSDVCTCCMCTHTYIAS